MALEHYDSVRKIIEQTGFTPELQTKISLFLSTAKNANAMFLGTVEFRPFVGIEQQMLHTQYFQELESVMLLSKVTRWATDPKIFSEAVNIAAPIINEWRSIAGFFGMGYMEPAGYYRGLALGHALLSQLRLSPIIPPNADPADPYVAALRRIEQDDARIIQTQITLLRSGAPELSADTCETLIESEQETIRDCFLNFLQWLTVSGPAPVAENA